MLNINQTISAFDLAQALEGDQGSFLARQNGQVFLVVAAQGHSIKSGPTPLGPPIAGVVPATESGNPWYITKLSDNDVTQGSGLYRQQGSGMAERR